MSTVGALIVVEIPVVTAAAFAAMGFYVRRFIGRLDEHDEVQETHGRAIAAHELRITAMEALVSAHARTIPQLLENVSTVVTIVDRHERWHERNDPTQHGSRSG